MKKKRGAKKRFIDVRIYLDTQSVYFGADRVDETEELEIQKIFRKELYRLRLENGYIENNEENRNYLTWLQKHF